MRMRPRAEGPGSEGVVPGTAARRGEAEEEAEREGERTGEREGKGEGKEPLIEQVKKGGRV